MLGPGLKGGNPDMKGDFTVVDSRALTDEGKEDCRLISLSCSDEFLAYLATKTKNYKYKCYNSKVWINEGRRIDYDAPDLPRDLATMLLRSNNKAIMIHGADRYGLRKQLLNALKYISNKKQKISKNTYPTNTYLSAFPGTNVQRSWNESHNHT